MLSSDIEQMFNRSLQLTFARKKFLFAFPPLVLCGVLIVFCRALAFHSGQWVKMSLGFLPFFLSAGILLALGVVLIRVYHHEVKKYPVSYRQTLRRSWELLLNVVYLSLPLVLGYFILWMMLGIFYLLKAIPKVGEALGLMLSFGPFLLVLGSLALSVFTLALLFYLTPFAALREGFRVQSLEEAFKPIRENPFLATLLLLVGLLPLLAIVGLLILAAYLTGLTYLHGEHSLSIAVQWFLIMIPFCALLSPGVIFFFNFAAESFVRLKARAA